MHIAICDDSAEEVTILKHTLRANFSNCSIKEFNNGTSLMDYLSNSVPDIILLDIELPSINGLELAKRIKQMYPQIGLIFVTAHSQYALEAFEVYAFDYLVKPVSMNRLVKSINQLMITHSDHKEKFVEIHTRGTVFRVQQNEIIFIEKCGHTCYVYTKSFTYKVRTPIYHFEKILDDEIFIRTHKGYLVNRNHIKSITCRGNMAYDIFFEATENRALLSRGMNERLHLVK